MARKRGIKPALRDAESMLARADVKASETLSRLEVSMMAMAQVGDGDGPVSMLRAVTQSRSRASAAARGDFSDAVKSGVWTLGSIIPGYFPGEPTILGGRPAMGKSAVSLAVTVNFCMLLPAWSTWVRRLRRTPS